MSVCLSVCLSVCVSLFYFGEGAVFRVENLHQYILGDDLSPLNVENGSYFGEKASGTLIYAGTAQSFSTRLGLARG